MATYKLLDDRFDKVSEGQVRVLLSVKDVLGELGNTFSVGLGLEGDPLLFQEGLDFLEVCNDTIVDNGELSVRVRAVRVGVQLGRLTVCGPTGVCLDESKKGNFRTSAIVAAHILRKHTIPQWLIKPFSKSTCCSLTSFLRAATLPTCLKMYVSFSLSPSTARP